ncbi:MAG TPA: RDD family protein, partial [Gemmataceae bacterium]|nr:RDD family protein [Gemmataceae bacterium]
MMAPDEVKIETPEQIDLALEPAGLGSRFVAAVNDFLIWGLFVLALLFLAALWADILGVTPSESWLQATVLGVVTVIVYATQLGYDIFFEMLWNGQTPGKKIAGVRVVRDGGAPIDFRSSCIRNLLRPADLLPMF